MPKAKNTAPGFSVTPKSERPIFVQNKAVFC